MSLDHRSALQAHIVELEELVDDLLVVARQGCPSSRKLAVDLHKEVMKRRERLRRLSRRGR